MQSRGDEEAVHYSRWQANKNKSKQFNCSVMLWMGASPLSGLWNQGMRMNISTHYSGRPDDTFGTNRKRTETGGTADEGRRVA